MGRAQSERAESSSSQLQRARQGSRRGTAGRRQSGLQRRASSAPPARDSRVEGAAPAALDRRAPRSAARKVRRQRPNRGHDAGLRRTAVVDRHKPPPPPRRPTRTGRNRTGRTAPEAAPGSSRSPRRRGRPVRIATGSRREGCHMFRRLATRVSARRTDGRFSERPQVRSRWAALATLGRDENVRRLSSVGLSQSAARAIERSIVRAPQAPKRTSSGASGVELPPKAETGFSFARGRTAGRDADQRLGTIPSRRRGIDCPQPERRRPPAGRAGHGVEAAPIVGHPVPLPVPHSRQAVSGSPRGMTGSVALRLLSRGGCAVVVMEGFGGGLP